MKDDDSTRAHRSGNESGCERVMCVLDDVIYGGNIEIELKTKIT